MATSYSVFPVSEASVVQWLKDRAIELPGDWEQSRYPTPAEIRLTLDRMPNYQVDYFITKQDWQATISEVKDPEGSIWALLIVLAYAGDENVPHKFYFERGAASVMRDILGNLTAMCGSSLLINNSDLSDTTVIVGPVPNN
jgi:hypothetical protein